MTMLGSQLMPEMGEFNVSNDLLGDRRALDAAWERDGYWFFRDVLDREVIARIRQVYVDYLVEMGVADAGDAQARYNGADYSGMPINTNVSRLNERKVHRLLHEAPTINAFFARLFGCEPFWVPFTVHRANPPVKDRSRSRFDFIHNDGVYNEGLPFLICWVPLDEIDAEVGGLAVVEGVHNGPSLHAKEGMTIHPIRLEDVPEGHWRRTTYRPGDVLLMSLGTPHSGLANVSKDRFRLSMDTRIMPSTGDCPVIGTISTVSAESVTLDTANGTVRLHFDGDSFVRGHRGDRMPLTDIPARHHTGDAVIVMAEGDRVLNMRPQH